MKTTFLRCQAVLAALTAILIGATIPAFAAFPEKPIKLIVPFPAGGFTDLVARIVSQQLGQTMGQVVVIDNRGGAGGVIGTELAALAPADGYTLFFATTGTIAINPFLYKSMKIDPLKAFEAVGLVVSTANVLVVPSSFGANTVEELIAIAKKKPGTLTFGSAGNGSSNHLTGELFKTMVGIDITHVPYKGSGAAITDLLAGRISMMFEAISTQTPLIASGKVKPLAVSSAARSKALPSVPTLAEAGLPGFDVSIWLGVLAPRGTPREIVRQLNQALNRVLMQDEIKAKLASHGALPQPGTPQAFALEMQKDTEKWSRVVKASGATLD